MVFPEGGAQIWRMRELDKQVKWELSKEGHGKDPEVAI